MEYTTLPESVTNLLDVPVKEEDTATDPNIFLQDIDLDNAIKLRNMLHVTWLMRNIRTNLVPRF